MYSSAVLAWAGPQSDQLLAEGNARLGLMPGPLSSLISAGGRRRTTTGGKSPGGTNEKETVGAVGVSASFYSPITSYLCKTQSLTDDAFLFT